MSQFDDVFAELRLALSAPLQQASPDEIRAALAVEGIDADAAEDFLGSLSRAASSIGSAVAPRLPGIIQGAMQGASTGTAAGPYGALIGALGGGLAGGLGAPPAAAPAAVAAAPAGLSGVPAAPAATSALLGAAGSGGAAGALLGLLSQLQVIQGLLSMLMGDAGSKSVLVAGHQVPPTAIANMVAEYANQAAAEWEEKYGVPEAATFPGLGEEADEAERAQAIAQAIAIEGLVRSFAAPIAHAESAYGESDYGESDYGESDYGEADYGDATYDPVYLG